MLKLHHAPNSRAGRIVWLLEELQLPNELSLKDCERHEQISQAEVIREPTGEFI